jgi:hypothetical protein
MIIPTIHLNGTPKDRLLEQNIEAGQALRVAIDKLSEAGPNGRDFYPQGDDAFREAQKEHISRLQRLQSVYKELEDLVLAIDEIESRSERSRL